MVDSIDEHDWARLDRIRKEEAIYTIVDLEDFLFTRKTNKGIIDIRDNHTIEESKGKGGGTREKEVKGISLRGISKIKKLASELNKPNEIEKRIESASKESELPSINEINNIRARESRDELESSLERKRNSFVVGDSELLKELEGAETTRDIGTIKRKLKKTNIDDNEKVTRQIRIKEKEIKFGKARAVRQDYFYKIKETDRESEVYNLLNDINSSEILEDKQKENLNELANAKLNILS